MKALTALPLVVALAAWSHAGVQHWGLGQGFLAAVQTVNGQSRVAVYAAPMRAKDATWIVRWLPATDAGGIVPGGLAVGDFWPGDTGSDRLALVRKDAKGLELQVWEPPQTFSNRPWNVVGRLRLSETAVVAMCAGDPTGAGRDVVLLLVGKPGAYRLRGYAPGATPGSPWSRSLDVAVSEPASPVAGMAGGKFWGDAGPEAIALAWEAGGKTRLGFYALTQTGLSPLAIDRSTDLPPLAPGGLSGGDYVHDTFDALTLVPRDAKAPIQIRVAPALPGAGPNPGPLYTGHAWSRQPLPGAGGSSTKLSMRARLQIAGVPRAVAVGRLFGYVRPVLSTEVRRRNKIDVRPDAEIAFTHRQPTYDITAGAPNYGWPLKGEAFGYKIAIKNNGASPIPAGKATLQVWIGTPHRNADTLPQTASRPDFEIPIKQALPPLTPDRPFYAQVEVKGKWPFDLVSCGPGSTWKRANVNEIGERWLVCRLVCPGDTNERNDRIEVSLTAWTLHPIFRSTKSLADRVPTVAGDPPSKEYLTRKLADVISATWERSGTTDNQDVLQKAFFDGYEIGWPADLQEPARSERWREIQKHYEGWRELDGWWGENQAWERFGWEDGAAELHETCHLFHPMGDLYQYAVHPVWTGGVKLADGRPVQLATYCWGPDSFSINAAMIGPPTCDLMREHLVGARNWGHIGWWEIAPDKLFVRVMDRDGKPVQGAKVSLNQYGEPGVWSSGTTGADGRWDTGHPKGRLVVDKFGIHHYPESMTGMTQIVTIQIGAHAEAAILGAESIVSHGRYAMCGWAIRNPDAWTWDYRLNWSPEAKAPDFALSAAVQGAKAELLITGEPGGRYVVYRRWEPAYVRTSVADVEANERRVRFTFDMTQADSHRSGRSRAILEVTRVAPDGSESQARWLSLTGVRTARGLTSVGGESFILASNNGIANPFGVLMDGPAPVAELFYHFRFGHTAAKIVPSVVTPGRYYATLLFSDMNPDCRFEIIEPPREGQGYDVRWELRWFDGAALSPTQTRIAPERARLLNAGDRVSARGREATIIKAEGGVITVDQPVFANQGGFDATRTPGLLGADLASRQLKEARGLCAFTVGGDEYVAIADTGNGRLVIWDHTTRYIANWSEPGARPAAVAYQPANGLLWVLDRRASGSLLRQLRFDGSSLVAAGPPVPIDVADWAEYREMGLAIATDGSLAITDASRGRVLVGRVDGARFTVEATLTQALGTFVGDEGLRRPIDAAFSASGALFVVDGEDRVVRVR